MHLCAHVNELAEADDIQMEYQFTDLLNCGDQLTRAESFDMHRRWARQCLNVLEPRADRQRGGAAGNRYGERRRVGCSAATGTRGGGAA